MVALRHNTQFRQTWEQALATAQLLVPGVPPAQKTAYRFLLQGTYRGEPIQIAVDRCPIGKHLFFLDTSVQLARPVEGLLLDLERRSDKAVGQSALVDVAVGDPSFDNDWILDGAPADAVRWLLSPEIRAAIVSLVPYACETIHDPVLLRINKKGLLLKLRGEVLDPRIYATIAEALLSIAARVQPSLAWAWQQPGGRERCEAELQVCQKQRARSNLINLVVLVCVVTLVLLILATCWIAFS